ncbi:MAG: M48 family metalloprotease [Candidatus Binatia bacterium]
MQETGWPDAVELEPGTPERIALFYQSPPQTIVCPLATTSASTSEACERLPFVPYATRRLALGAAREPGPWPVTITEPRESPLRGPTIPYGSLPTTPLDGPAYTAYADAERKQYDVLSSGAEQERAAAAFARLVPVAQAEGLEWRLVVVRAERPLAFGEPDGSLFVSDELVRRLDDEQLVALLAHLMGHERNGHDRSCWKTLRTAEKMGLVTGGVLGTAAVAAADAFVILGVLVGGLPQGAPPLVDPTLAASGVSNSYCPDESVPQRVFTPILVRQREFEANRLAVEYLHKLDVPPGALFDAIVQLSPVEAEPAEAEFRKGPGGSPRGPNSTPEFAQMHYARQSAADLGRLFDMGLTPSTAPDSWQEFESVTHCRGKTDRREFNQCVQEHSFTAPDGGIVKRYGGGLTDDVSWWPGVCKLGWLSMSIPDSKPVFGVLMVTRKSVVFQGSKPGTGTTRIPFTDIESVTFGLGHILVKKQGGSCDTFMALLHLLALKEAGALIQKGVDDARRLKEAGAADTPPAAEVHSPTAAEVRIPTTNDGGPSPDTMAGDETMQLNRQLKWIQHLKDVGALSSEEHEELRLKALQDYPNAKPE